MHTEICHKGEIVLQPIAATYNLMSRDPETGVLRTSSELLIVIWHYIL